ncbi:uncharacterized protein [Parasteatoda tepidariorum]|uniref:uncharacterized protein n=1 Tax=Parasteatoda tepidariorum TaxID=114398 RepID=UPI001C7193BA|nr:uncharacterized protein LOC107438381 [Parasteatoda tepidariorum]
MEFDLKWAHGKYQGSSTFLSSKDIVIPCDTFLKICDSTGSNFRDQELPCPIPVGGLAALPELGVLAVCDKETKPNIHVFSFPKYEKISILKQVSDLEYKLLKFTGIDYLISFGFGVLHSKADIWKWSSGELLKSISILPPIPKSVPLFLTVNPLSWYLLTLQIGEKLYHFEINFTNSSLNVRVDEICFDRNDIGGFILKRVSASSSQSEVNNDGEFQLACHSWISDDCICLGSPHGVFKSSTRPGENNYLVKAYQNDQPVTSMCLTPSGLFLGFVKNIKLIDISSEDWIVLNDIEIDYTVTQIISSPDFSVVIAETKQGLFSWDQTCKKMFNLFKVFELSNIIDVCVIGPTSEHFAVAIGTGLLHFFQFEDGSMISSISIEEEITSFAVSPLCSLVAAGTNSGYIYLVSIVDIRIPVIIHYVLGHETTIDGIKFDDFGRYLFTVNQDKGINIWNASPESNFGYLGHIKIAQRVKGVVTLTDFESDHTDILILAEDGSNSEERSGNVLIRLSLPFDFKASVENYYIDSFGTLNIESLFYQKWHFDYPCSNLDVQKNMGAILYSPITKQIQKFSLWTDSVSRQTDLIEMNDISYLTISFNQRYLAAITKSGTLQLFSNKSMTLIASVSANVTAPSNDYVLEFSRYGNSLLVASDAGYLSRVEWDRKHSSLEIIPKSLVHCQMYSENENSELLKVNEEKEGGNAIKRENAIRKENKYLTFDMWVDIMYFRLKNLLKADIIEDSKKLLDAHFVFDDRFLNNLSDRNFIRFLKCLEREGEYMEISDIQPHSMPIKVISSTNLGYIVYNYTTIQFLPGRFLEENVRSLKLNKANIANVAMQKPASFKISMDLSKAKDIILLLENIRKQVCYYKLDFNKTFNDLYEEANVFSDKLSELSFKIKTEIQSLPSKAEKDLWNAIAIAREKDEFTPENSNDLLNSEVVSDVENASKTKQSIESLADAARCLRVVFDSKVERLFLRKLFCDYIIHANELKIFCSLLLVEAQCVMNSWTKRMVQQLDLSKILNKDICAVIKKTTKIGKSYHQLYKKIQEIERSAALRFETKCSKLDSKAEISKFYKYQPRKLYDAAYWLPSITSEYLSSDVFQVMIPPPENIDMAKKWQKMCSRKSRLLKLNAILRCIQQQCINITRIKIHCEEIQEKEDCNLFEETEKISNVDEILSKLTETVRLLLSNNLDADMQEYFRIAGMKLSDIPLSNHFIWEGIKNSTERNKNLQIELENTGALIDDFQKLASDQDAERTKIKQNYQLILKELQSELDDQKKLLTNISDIIDHLNQTQKWNVFKKFA